MSELHQFVSFSSRVRSHLASSFRLGCARVIVGREMRVRPVVKSSRVDVFGSMMIDSVIVGSYKS